MEIGHFLKLLNDASLASLGFLMRKVMGCIICKKNHCGYSRDRLDQKSLFGCRTKTDEKQRRELCTQHLCQKTNCMESFLQVEIPTTVTFVKVL